jgi:hypothetical protein
MRPVFGNLWKMSYCYMQRAVSLNICKSQSYFAIGSLSVSTSWCRAHSGTYDQMLFSFRSFLSCLFFGALSDEGSGLSFVSLSL